MSPAALIIPPSSLNRNVKCPFLFASLRASSIIASTASFVKCGIFLSLVTSCAMNRAIFCLFSGVSCTVSFMNISYPYPLILLRSAGCMCCTVSTFPAATRMKLHGTGSVLTIAPADLSLCPVMLYFPSCSEVNSSCCVAGSSVAISSTNNTPMCALCISPATTLSCAGVPSPPDCSGSCKTSPNNAPACAPVASQNGACFFPWLSTIIFGASTFCAPGILLPTLMNITYAAKNSMPPRKNAVNIMSLW